MSDPIRTDAAVPLPSHGLRASARVLLYTDQAARLWVGGPSTSVRSKSRPANAPCLLQAFAVLQELYNATANDNPFAEAALVRLEDGLAEIRTSCHQRIATVSELLADRAADGVETPLVTSEKRHVFELIFGTPYHYILADCIALWDKAVRHLMTVSLTGLLSGTQVRDAIAALQKPMLAALHHLIRDAFALRRYAGHGVSRAALNANEPAALAFQTEWINREHTPVSSDVLNGTRRPLHMRIKGWKARP